MSKRLEVTLFGTLHSVGMLRMNRTMVKAGMDIYGPRKWNRIVNEIALGDHSRKRINEVNHTIGHTIKLEYQESGIVMQGHGFGMEVFYGGEYFPINMVESKNRTLQPSCLMQGYKTQDMLGVFWGRQESAMFFRWEDVGDLSQEDLVLAFDSLAPALAKKRSFDLAVDVTLKGRKGRRKDVEPAGNYEIQKHVFHMMK